MCKDYYWSAVPRVDLKKLVFELAATGILQYNIDHIQSFPLDPPAQISEESSTGKLSALPLILLIRPCSVHRGLENGRAGYILSVSH